MSKSMNMNIRFIAHEAVVGLTVSTVSLSLGGAFGILSERGVLIGMITAALYPLITSIIGGTKIQCSGPTGPMTTVFVALVASAAHSLQGLNEMLIPAFLNMTLFLTAALLLIAGILKLGNYVTIVPNIVISGFMDGIALIIWISQLKKLLQIGSPVIDGSLLLNCMVALGTLAIALCVSRVARSLSSYAAALLSGTLIALIVMTIVCHILQLPVGRIAPDISLHSWEELSSFVAVHSPLYWPWHLVLLAFPWALQLAGVAYLDTLLTSLIIDRKTHTTSRRNRELGAQACATAVVAMIGGIPGAQATERSILMKKEGAQSRLAGMFVGIFGLVGVFLLQDVVYLIPKAVFAGILLKVGYDVFDWQPFILYCKQRQVLHFKKRSTIANEEMLIIILTAVGTVVWNIMVSVCVFTAVFYVLKKHNRHLHDLRLHIETEGMTDEP